jgi:hypothetical protein
MTAGLAKELAIRTRAVRSGSSRNTLTTTSEPTQGACGSISTVMGAEDRVRGEERICGDSGATWLTLGAFLALPACRVRKNSRRSERGPRPRAPLRTLSPRPMPLDSAYESYRPDCAQNDKPGSCVMDPARLLASGAFSNPTRIRQTPTSTCTPPEIAVASNNRFVVSLGPGFEQSAQGALIENAVTPAAAIATPPTPARTMPVVVIPGYTYDSGSFLVDSHERPMGAGGRCLSPRVACWLKS